MKVKSLQFNWHQVGSTIDRDGSGENYHRHEVGKNHVHEIVEYPPTMSGEVWNYKVFLEDGTIYRVFNPNFVEYFKEEPTPDLFNQMGIECKPVNQELKELFESMNPNI